MQQRPEPVCLPSVPVARDLVQSATAPQGDGGQVAAQHGDPQLQAEMLAALKEMVTFAAATLSVLDRESAQLLRDELDAAGIEPGACARADALIVRAEGRL